MGIYSLWNDRARTRRTSLGSASLWTPSSRTSPGGVYVNELGEDEGNDRVRLAYGANYARLAQIKAQVRSDNLFRLNANIVPA